MSQIGFLRTQEGEWLVKKLHRRAWKIWSKPNGSYAIIHFAFRTSDTLPKDPSFKLVGLVEECIFDAIQPDSDLLKLDQEKLIEAFAEAGISPPIKLGQK